MALMGKYLYCFIKEKEKKNFGTSSICGFNAPVYTINLDEIAAVVSDAPIIDYLPSRKNSLAHQKVLNLVLEEYTIIPVAFGTVANNKKGIEIIIKSNYELFLKNIRRLKNQVELGLKITWDALYFDEDIQDEKIMKLKQAIEGKEENKVLNEKILLGKMVEAAIKEKREIYREKIYTPLEKIATESKFKENLPIKTILNCYFLVDKANEAIFDETVEKFKTLYNEKLIFSYTGPWAPYNFTNIRIEIN